jgi:hypothetical protein
MSMTAVVLSLAAGLTLLHVTVRKTVADAPGIDVPAHRALATGLRAVGAEVPPGPQLHAAVLVGNLVVNNP